MVELFVVNGICAGTVFFLPDVPTVVGRSPESHVQLADPWVSSMHALFELRGGQLWLVDLDSRNGTFVEDKRVQEAPIGPGSRIRFGRTSAEVRQHKAAQERGVRSDHRTILRYVADLAADVAPSALAAPAQPAEAPPPEPPPAPEPQHDTLRPVAAARRQVSVLNELGRALLGAGDLADALRRLLRVLAKAIGAERSSVLLMDERGEMVQIVAEPADRQPGVSATVLDATLRSRAGILTVDAQQDLRFSRSDSVIAHGIQSCIGAPIWADNRILGVLLLERSFTHPFTPEDLELATMVGFQAALAVDRVRIAERERASEELRSRLLRHLGSAGAASLLTPDGADRDPLEPVLLDGVAVVAAALEGHAEVAARNPPAEAARRVLALQRALAETAQVDGAAVDMRLDGGVLAVFDLAHARPRAKERARRCAEALLERAAAQERGLEPRLSVRVGAASGRALVGNFGPPERPELRAVGEAVEAAVRRASRAAPGTARLDDEP